MIFEIKKLVIQINQIGFPELEHNNFLESKHKRFCFQTEVNDYEIYVYLIRVLFGLYKFYIIFLTSYLWFMISPATRF